MREERPDAGAHLAVGGVVQPLDLGASDPRLADDGQGARQQACAERAQLGTVTAADEELGAEVLLEPGEAGAQRLLGEVQLLGRAVQVAEPRDADEVAELAQFQALALRRR
ncbi:MAG: hypothetical protein MUF07_16280 [Steroidobacteraceae bacterium]|jgi:hypothetical protein|nr:hypothetical protein [Steroidobacteraceae bacterium]